MNKTLLTLLLPLLAFTAIVLDMPPGVTTGGNQSITNTYTTVTAIPTGSSPFAITWSKFPVTLSGIKVGMIGSSTTVGVSGTTSVDSSWARYFSRYYKNYKGWIDTVYNRALGGTDPRQGMPTWYTRPGGWPALDQNRNTTALIGLGVDLAFIDFPTNGINNMTNAEWLLCYRVMRADLEAHGIVTYVWGTQPRDEYGNTNRLRLIAINDSLRLQHGDHFIDKLTFSMNSVDYSLKTEYNFTGDAIHMNNLGQRRIWDIARSMNVFKDFVTNGTAITSPTSASTSITGFTPGTYKYHVRVIDNLGLNWDTTLQISATIAPVTPAGDPIRHTRFLRYKP